MVLRSRSGKPIEDGYSQSGSGVLLLGLQPELAAQPLGAGGRDVDGATTVGATQPAQLEQARGERAAERAGQVVGLLGPVHAVAHREAVGVVDPEPRQPARACACEAVVDVAAGRGQLVLPVAVEVLQAVA